MRTLLRGTQAQCEWFIVTALRRQKLIGINIPSDCVKAVRRHQSNANRRLRLAKSLHRVYIRAGRVRDGCQVALAPPANRV